MTSPFVKKNRGISAIWTLPLIALCICGWLVYSSFKNAGVEITIIFSDASGIVPGKTQVMTRGIPIGQVTKLYPDLKNNQIQVKVKMEKSVADQLVEDTLFWIVRPELSASAVHGLDTILSGSYISMRMGTSPSSRREFTGLDSLPSVSPDSPGLHLKIRAEVLGSIQAGTGIYYRNIKIGEVQNYQLEGDKNISIEAFITPEYAKLVREGSRFCNVSGIQISGKLPSVKVQMESIASLLRGGILLFTPEQLANTPEAKNGTIFTLYPDLEAAHYGIPMTLTLASSENIVEGSTKIMYRGLEAGYVKEIEINDDARRSVTAHILLDPRAELILRENTKFWLVKPEISPSGIDNLQLLLSGAHITFQPGDGKFCDHFDILTEPPPQVPLRHGKTFLLTTNDRADITTKSPVYYKNVQVGEIVDVDLDTSKNSVRSTLFIYQKYLPLLSKKSVFWIQSGIEIRGGFTEGVSLSTGPLAKMLQGGVSFFTPEQEKSKLNSTPDEGFTFKLHHSYQDAVATLPTTHQQGKRVLLFAPDAESLSIGAPLLFKKVKIGEVVGFSLAADHKAVHVDCLIHDAFKDILKPNTKFYNISGIQVSGGLEGLKVESGSLQTILQGGIGCFNPPPDSTTQALPSSYRLFADLKEATMAENRIVHVILNETSGLKEGSPVRYNGIDIGKVTSMQLGEKPQTVTAEISVEEKGSALFQKETKIWVEHADFSLAGIKNPESLVFGPYLNILPGKGGAVDIITALPEAPLTETANQNGLGIILETSHLGSLSVGSPLYYRQVQIGEVTGYNLSPAFEQVLIYVNIKSKYAPIVRKNSKFWQVSGTKIEGGIFSGVTVSVESLSAVIRGGLALATPPEKSHTHMAVSSGHHFPLHDKPEKEWQEWSPELSAPKQ